MSVTSLPFFALLAATLALLGAAPMHWRRWILLGASIIFYTSASAAQALFMAALIGINFLFLRGVVLGRKEVTRDRIYLAAIVFNAVLFAVMKLVFEPAPGATAIKLSLLGQRFGYPLGLSFVILMLHGAITDAHSGKYVPRLNVINFALFGSFFPYISAGPIERLAHMDEALAAPRRPVGLDLQEGLSLIALGLVKKLVVANRVKGYVDAAFIGDLTSSVPALLLAIALNTMYLYSDFSGYTDIARGAARCLGIELLPNFNRPFVARSVTEFWRRWHMTFSNWLRDYLYMPLAFMWGRSGWLGQSGALLITFVLCGFWHRVGWTFALFGLLHGIALVAETRVAAVVRPPAGGMVRVLWIGAGHLYLLTFIGATELLFTAPTVRQAGLTLSRLATSPLRPTLADMMAYKGPALFAIMLIGIGLWQIFELWRLRLNQLTLPLFLGLSALTILFLGQPEGGGFVYVQF